VRRSQETGFLPTAKPHFRHDLHRNFSQSMLLVVSEHNGNIMAMGGRRQLTAISFPSCAGAADNAAF
jgi:hypothetical protein